MHTGGRLVAGSHNINEFVLINADESAQIKSVQELSEQVCQICGDEIEVPDEGKQFVAYNECAFPVCRPCYDRVREKRGKSSVPSMQNQIQVHQGFGINTFFACLFTFLIWHLIPLNTNDR